MSLVLFSHLFVRPVTLMLAKSRSYVIWLSAIVFGPVILYLGFYVLFYIVLGLSVSNKYNQYYFNDQSYYIITKRNETRLWDWFPRTAEWADTVYSPILITTMIIKSEPCPVDLIENVSNLRKLYVDSRRGIVGKSYMQPYGYGLSLVNAPFELAKKR